MLRLTVVDGGAPALDVEVYRGAVTIGDTYSDTYEDTYGGSVSVPAWFAMGRITLDSPDASAVLTDVRMESINPDAVTLRLRAAAIADAFVTLRRGERMVRVQHGSTTHPAPIAATRRIRWTASPSPVGTAFPGRVEEASAAPGFDGLHRFVAALTPVSVDAGAFALASESTTTARLGAGIGVAGTLDRTLDLHRQLADATRVLEDVEEEE